MQRRDALKWIGVTAAGAFRSPLPEWSATLHAQAAPVDWAARISALPGPVAGEIVVSAVGDMIISSPAAGRKGPAVEQMYRVLRESDAAFGNCEEPVASVGFMYPKTSQMAWPPILDDFKAAGFNMLNVANNHYMDLGPDGLLQGLQESRQRGFAVAGAGRDLDAALTPGIRNVKGVRVGLLGFWCNQEAYGGYVDYARAGKDKPGVAVISGYQVAVPDAGGIRELLLPQASDLKMLRDAIQRARSQVDFLMVSFHQHWGGPGLNQGPADGGGPAKAAPRDGNFAGHAITPADLSAPVNQVAEGRRMICRAAIDAGADVIVGHGPHVLNGVEIYKGKPILYSLGHYYMEITHDGKALPQFEFDPGMVRSVETNWFLEEHRWAAIARMIVRAGKVTRLEILPVYMDVQKDGFPVLPSDADCRTINKAMQELSKPFSCQLQAQGWYTEVMGL
jgi:hypothetical protein